MNDADVSKQIQQMVRFIRQEAEEKANEISVSAEEGRFEILSLSGSYIPTENAGTKSRSGGMSISLASPDGRVVGGGLAGLLIAAGPVQVVVGSFLPGHQ